MIDINLNHALMVVWPFNEDLLEYKGCDQEFYALDFKVEEHARYAIKKWLLPCGWSLQGNYQRKEACRFCLTKRLPFGNIWLPGIDDKISNGINFSDDEMRDYDRNLQRFQLWVWEEVFPDELFSPAVIDEYRQRVDGNFCTMPDAPDMWDTAEYLPWNF